MIMTVTAGELRKDDYLVIDGGAWRVLNDSELLVDFDDQDPLGCCKVTLLEATSNTVKVFAIKQTKLLDIIRAQG
jgi:hypothetical protein|nr:MAG TPA: Elongation factor P (EF-P) KOW-like domain [Caudoviricetes sp.]